MRTKTIGLVRRVALSIRDSRGSRLSTGRYGSLPPEVTSIGFASSTLWAGQTRGYVYDLPPATRVTSRKVCKIVKVEKMKCCRYGHVRIFRCASWCPLPPRCVLSARPSRAMNPNRSTRSTNHCISASNRPRAKPILTLGSALASLHH